MPHRWSPARAFARSFLTLLWLFGCAPQPSIRAAPTQELSNVPVGLDIGSTDSVYPGSLDSKNLYLSNVIIAATFTGRPTQGCSGVLLSPDRALTAAHCVCEKREATDSDRVKANTRLDEAFSSNGKDDASKKQIAAWKSNILDQARVIADTSDCLKQVEVTVINYVASTGRYLPVPYKGRVVRPHPRFLSIDDDANHGLFREADLAIIQLDKAVTESFRPIQLPKAEVYKNQQIVMVGYGLGETEYPTTKFGYRHFGDSQIAKVEHFDSGSTRFITMDQDPDGREFTRNYGGDSGGGAFSQVEDSVLVGIVSSRRDSQGGIFESVYPHVGWLSAATPSN